MPDYLKRTGRDVTEDTTIRIPEAEKTIARLHGPANKRLSIDRGDIPTVAAPFEGQMMIQYADNSPYVGEHVYYYSNGQWRPFFPTPVHSIAIFRIASPGSIAVSAGSGGFPDLDYITGDSGLLDLTTPAAPTFTVACVATIDMTFSSTTVLWTAGATFQGKINADIAGLSEHPDQWGTVTIGTDQAPRQGFTSLTAPFAIGEGFTIELLNNDSGARDMTIDQLVVTKIYET